MKVLNVRNVNDALFRGFEYLRDRGAREQSRAGPVLVAPCPVTTVYSYPQERVLFSPIRDANPFFHLFESLWMLAGRNDAAWLDQFVGDFSKRFAEEDGTVHGAYGYRWRKAFGFDQLEVIVGILKRDSTSRQCVLQMWDALPEIHYDLLGNWKDRPCNTHVYFRIREEQVLVPPDGGDYQEPVLDITVCCRSNDIIWGAYGANAVHFSVLQEYMAARIGVGVGRYYQFSNNYHAYADMFDKLDNGKFVEAGLYDSYSYKKLGVVPTPIVTVPDKFDLDLHYFFSGTPAESGLYENLFFPEVAIPLYDANKLWKGGHRVEALARVCALPSSNDWVVAAGQWFRRRVDKKLKEMTHDR